MPSMRDNRVASRVLTGHSGQCSVPEDNVSTAPARSAPQRNVVHVSVSSCVLSSAFASSTPTPTHIIPTATSAPPMSPDSNTATTAHNSSAHSAPTSPPTPPRFSQTHSSANPSTSYRD
ncbi:hypothetical protein NX059_002536 [Plenodomus lindquistii]|nr:hypothetical protein NX059_002536 [Plenodomus lindquistii]